MPPEIPNITRLDFEPRWFVVIVFFAAGIFIGSLGLFIWIFNRGPLFSLQKIHANKNRYQFINPLLAVDTVEKKEFLKDKSLENKISKIIEKAKSDGGVYDAAFYFRDLEPGRWTGVNENLVFSAGKILKLPIMIAYLKGAESDPGLLDEKIIYSGAGHLAQKNSPSLQSNGLYTIHQLIQTMITEDDDDAADVLFDNIDKSALNDVYGDLGLDFNEDKETDDYISLRANSLFLRVLYNATYLNRNMSEKALAIMSQSKINNSVINVLPRKLLVAQRYRRRTFVDEGERLTESHICGIIYYPLHPYLICMMSMGKNSKMIDDTFNKMSLLTYNDMMDRYKNDNPDGR